MARIKERDRIKLLIDAGGDMNEGWALRLEGDRLLIDSGVMFTRGQRVVVYPMSEENDVDVLEFKATVEDCCEDIMVPADAAFRFLVTLETFMPDFEREALGRAISGRDALSPKARSRRRNLHTHDKETLDLAFNVAQDV